MGIGGRRLRMAREDASCVPQAHKTHAFFHAVAPSSYFIFWLISRKNKSSRQDRIAKKHIAQWVCTTCMLRSRWLISLFTQFMCIISLSFFRAKGVDMKATDRRPFVQAFRRLATTYDIEKVPDNAAREKVRGLVDSLRDCSLTADDAELLEANWEAYRDSWAD